ncbi:ammonium transporter AmtB-like domain-containing protein [Peziza echinospora]|nr:ammonium transporter AmtB-like domain-containing protein [Peziza echinospora]
MSYSHFGAPREFNGTTPLGGNSREVNLNQWFTSGDQAYILIASAMVLVMVPGLGFLYSGLARRKSALSMIWACLGSCAVVTFQWYFWGYSLAFSSSATNGYIGNLKHFALIGVLGTPSPGSPYQPELLYSFYQLMFASVTVAIVMGAIAERGRVLPAMVFSFIWTTLVYCPIACWVWGANGWAFKWGVMDYAGGGPVEIASGVAALAYSLVLGKRQEKMLLNFRPHNVSLITLGTILLWFGWLGFNGGSSFGANLRAVMACWNTNITAVVSAITWSVLDFRLAKKWSMVGFCSGLISGLVAATPASGFLTPHASVLLGFFSGVICNYSTKIKYLIGIDDTMDVFAEHGVAGIVGLVFNGFFGVDWVIALDGVNNEIPGGFFSHNYKQLGIQIAYILACCAYTFVVTLLICYAINAIPGLHLRATEQAELLGMDDDQLGEFAYDYVEVRRDYLAWTPAKEFHDQNTPVTASDRHGIATHSEMIEGEAPTHAAGSGSSHPDSITEEKVGPKSQ